MKRTREWIALFLLALIAPLLPGQADGSDQARQQPTSDTIRSMSA
jgi:hypothetical protein